MSTISNNDATFLQRLTLRFPFIHILFSRNNSSLKETYLNIRGYYSIKKNKLLDREYYLKTNLDVESSCTDPIIHYIYHGYKEGRNPSKDFDSNFYFNSDTDVKNSRINPLVHYSLYGMKEGRKPRRDNLKKEIANLKRELEIQKEKVRSIENKIEMLKIKQEKELNIPDFTELKKSLKGKNNYLFLINDSNNEIRQHFDQLYTNNFKPNLFIESIKSKQQYCRERNIKYYFCIVPDKSYVCRDLLPFQARIIKRNCDAAKKLVLDFQDKLKHEHYWKTDTHINFMGGLELAYHIINHINPDLERDQFDQLIQEQTVTRDDYQQNPRNDLLNISNWSYSDGELPKYSDEKTIYFLNKYVKRLDDIPRKFKFNSSINARESLHFLNNNACTDLKILFFRDSSASYLTPAFTSYYKEVLLYWDHWFFNKDLIEWYKPDIILEIRTERFLENMEYEIV